MSRFEWVCARWLLIGILLMAVGLLAILSVGVAEAKGHGMGGKEKKPADAEFLSGGTWLEVKDWRLLVRTPPSKSGPMTYTTTDGSVWRFYVYQHPTLPNSGPVWAKRVEPE